MFRGGEYARSVFDINRGIARRMQNQQCLAQRADALVAALAREVIEKLLANVELAARQRDFGYAVGIDRRGRVGKQMLDMPRIVRRADSRHRGGFGYFVRRRQHRSAAETVTDEYGRRLMLCAQPVGRSHQIGDIG